MFKNKVEMFTSYDFFSELLLLIVKLLSTRLFSSEFYAAIT